jgi:putative ABC transport system permease protein
MKSFIKPAVRSLRKNKIHALINLFGLSLGLTVSVFIYLFVEDELSYDKNIPRYEDVFRIQGDVVTASNVQSWASSEGYIVPAISNSYPELQAATRGLPLNGEMLIKTDSAQFSEANVWAVDSTFFEVFSFPFVYGERAKVLDGPGSMVISKSLAKKYFGDANPVGKFLVTEQVTYTVTGVIEDMGDNNHFHPRIFVSLKRFWSDADESRGMMAFYSYVRATKGNAKVLAQKLRGDAQKISGNETSSDPDETRIEIKAVPLAEIHLGSHAEKEIEANGNQQVVIIFIGAALLILLIASINYINLSNAIAVKRAKEIAVRKTIGATRAGLFLRFLMESYIFVLLAFTISIVTVALTMPWFNTLTGKHLAPHLLIQPGFIFLVVVGWIVLGFLSGLYPAAMLSSFNPVQALKSGFNEKSGKASLYLRRTFITFQFAVSALMIVCALSIQRQMNFIDNLDIGFQKENVVALTLSGDAYEKLGPLKQELEKLKEVVATSAMAVVPGKRIVVLNVRVPDLAGTKPTTEGDDDGSRAMRVLSVDHDVVKTLGLKIKEGRDFSDVGDGDTQHGFMLNEAAVKFFDLKDPIGKPFEYTFGSEPKKGEIIAVVKDFNFASIHNPVEPLMIHIMPWYSVLCVRVEASNTEASIEALKAVWKNVSAAPFSYSFLDSTYDALYKSDKASGKIVSYFTILSIVIACLGLFGVVSFFAKQRMKEVGVRKIFGASTQSLLGHLSKEYLIMVLVGNLLAIYPAWLLVEQWLQQFAYRVDFSPLIFLVTLTGSVVLACGSMFYILMNVTHANPANVLRNE